MPLIPTLGRAVGTTIRGTRLLGRGTVNSGRWMTRRVGRVRARGSGGEVGMARLLDLHAASYAGDALVTIGLAGTIFFSAAAGEARTKVALYLVVTMVPFALLAPVVGPLLDHFRHGRRYALAATMLGRAFLAWLISDYIHGFGLYPAAFGVLALSRVYGVARSAAVPRLLPERLGLSEANARASVYGTIAGAAVTPLGVAAFQVGPQWPLRIASVIFLVGMVTALRLPPRADSDPPEAVPRLFRLGWPRRGRDGAKILSGRLVLAALAGAASLRALNGFLLLFLAFSLKSGDLSTELAGVRLGPGMAVGLVGGAVAAGTFLASAVGTRLRIRRPATLQASWLVLVTVVAGLAALRFTLLTVSLLCLVAAIGGGLAKLSVDAAIQERIGEQVRASAFAHSETLLMLAWVAGGAFGLIPFHGRLGVTVAAGWAVLATARALLAAGRLRREKLSGRVTGPDAGPPADRVTGPDADRVTGPPAGPAGPDVGGRDPGRSGAVSGAGRAGPGGAAPVSPATAPVSPATAPVSPAAPPGFHIYRPSAPDSADGPRPTWPEPGGR